MLNRTDGRTIPARDAHLVACLALTLGAWQAGSSGLQAQTLAAASDLSLISSAPACTPGQISVPLVEWDLESQGDIEPGAITVDVQSSSSDPARVWFVTRQIELRLYRFIPSRARRGAPAQWRSWVLDLNGVTTGGLKKIKPSKDKRQVFVRTTTSLQQVDTQCSGTSTCGSALTVFRDRPFTIDRAASDVAVDDYNNVFTTAPDDFTTSTFEGYVQKLNPNALRTATAADLEALGIPDATHVTTATRWIVGGGAGLCPSVQELSEFDQCLAGVDLDNERQHLVYYSESLDNNIGELNTKTTGTSNNVRFWSLDDLALRLGWKAGEIFDPRHLKVEKEHGKTVVWVVTGSGHIVRLIPQSGDYALMSAHRMPDVGNDPFGIAPDGGVIGYTSVADSLGDRKDKVGMLLPKDTFVQVKTRVKVAPQVKPTIAVQRMATSTTTGTAGPDLKKAPGRVARNAQGDTFVDGFINLAPQPGLKLASMSPTGITPDYGSKVGTFFYAVGRSGNLEEPVEINRIGLAILPQAERPKRTRDDDDFDGDGKKNRYEDDDDDDDGTPNHMDRDNDNDCRDDDLHDDDDDNDGNEDKWDDPRKKETRDSRDHTTGPGTYTEHQMVATAATTLLVAQAKAADAAAPLRIEVFGPSGVKLASPLPTPGVALATLVPATAGTYTVRVTNLSLAAVSLTTDLIAQELWPALSPVLP